MTSKRGRVGIEGKRKYREREWKGRNQEVEVEK